MEVRFLYDANALYVGARMWSEDPSDIQAPLGRRDSVSQAERVFVSLDTFLDRRTAYTFGVTASGVRMDVFNPIDDQRTEDPGFNPVWEARTTINTSGWIAELWIPFSQLRFNDQTEQVWGLNVGRFIPTRNEEDYWILIPRTETAWSSRFGELRGLDGIRPSRRLELLPYVSAGAVMNGDRDPGNPFDSGHNLAGRVGADVKVGLGPNLTLDITVNPDFGQVEADPAEVNLSAFETVFPERRPFFTEGSRLMNLVVAGANNLFNSRRIGGRPTGPATGLYVDYPDTSTILAAGKITGRTSRGTSIGVLGGFTDAESAPTVSAGSPQINKIRVAPRSAYGVGRIQQEFGRSGSTVSAMLTGVHRDMAEGDALAALLPRNALGLGSDAILRFKGGEYEVTLAGLTNNVTGETAAIERLQRSSTHYFQRPDRKHSRIDPSRTSLYGYKVVAGIERRSGRHWLWETQYRAISPGMEPNDIGRVGEADGINHNGSITYRETRPGRLFRSYAITLFGMNDWDFDHDLIGQSFRPSVNLTFRNFWTVSGGVTRNFRALNLTLTRGGPMMQRPAGWTANATLSNAASAQTRWSGTVTLAGNEDRGQTHRVNGSFSFRPGPRWQLSIDPSFDRTADAQQYVTTLRDGSPETYGSRYVFSYIDRRTVSTEIRMSLTVKPDVNLDVYAEPFASSGRYYDFGELMRAGGRERLTYGTSGTTVDLKPEGDRVITTGQTSFTLANRDFNLRSLRSNVVLRWEWRPGSTLYLVWQQDRELRRAVGTPAGFADAFRSLTAPGNNSISLKTSFWLPR